MRIGIDIRSLMDAQYSGVGEYTFNLLDNLFKIDQENQYFLFYNSFKDIKNNLPKWDYENVKFVGFHWPNKIFNFCQKFLKYPKVDHLLGGMDIFFLPNWNFIALSNQCKKVITVHDLSYYLYPRFYSLKRKIWHWLVNPKKLIKNFDKIIAVSENTKNDLINLYKIEPDKIKIIYSGTPNTQHPTPQNQIDRVKEKYNLPNKFILYLGTLEPRKNIKRLIQAFDELINKNIDIELVIAGCPGWSCTDIYQTAQKAKNKDKIRFIGYVEPEYKFYLYQLASVFVYPSFYEGFGLPILEAMQAGCPVITSLNSSLPEIAGNAALLIDPYYLNDLAEAMVQVLTDEELRKKMIAKGLKQSQKFDWKKTAEETLEIFKLK